MLDSKLTWKPQINLVTKKVNREHYGLRFIKTCLIQELRQRLVTTLIIPHLDYYSVVYLDASAELRTRLRTRLQRLSNSCVTYIYGVRTCERIRIAFRISLGWLRTDTRRLYSAGILMYKSFASTNLIIQQLLSKRYQYRGPTRGDRKYLAIPGVRTNTRLLSFQARYVHLWNSLPSSVRDLQTLTGVINIF